jgi:hypothetical protein
MRQHRLRFSFVVMLPLILSAASALAAPSQEELAKLAQNPIANLISVPFQNNTNFNSGPLDGTQNVLNIQPVIPFGLSKNLNLITRTILPVVTQPGTTPGQSSVTGLGDLQWSGFVSPKAAKNGFVYGGGMIVQAPTHTDSRLGNGHWGVGPSAVALRIQEGSHWVYGALVNNVFSVGSNGDPSYSNFLLQPFINYNFTKGLYFTFAPIMTAAWKAPSGEKWVVPVGGGFGKIFRLGKLPVNSQLSAYYNAKRPTDSANWQLRAQVQFMFPR